MLGSIQQLRRNANANAAQDSQPAEKHNSHMAPMVRLGTSLRMEIRTKPKPIRIAGGPKSITKMQVTRGTQKRATGGIKPQNESS